jgi:hypothetical protein
MAKMSHVMRRRKLTAARRRAEGHVARAVRGVLDKQYKWLKRDLRRQNLRKRFQKASGALFKQDDPQWEDWADAFEADLSAALADGAGWLAEVERQYWTSRGVGEVFNFDPVKAVLDYQTRVGSKIKKIALDTLPHVQEDIAKWFNTDKSLPELIEQLSQYFGETRAELIATTEMGYVASEVAYGQMGAYGIDEWFWDAIMDGVVCEECASIMIVQNGGGAPFAVGDPMPPEHPRCRCGILYARNGVAID